MLHMSQKRDKIIFYLKGVILPFLVNVPEEIPYRKVVGLCELCQGSLMSCVAKWDWLEQSFHIRNCQCSCTGCLHCQ